VPVKLPPPLRAPRQDGAVVAQPPLAEVGRLLEANQQRLAAADFAILGRSAADLRRQARQAILTEAAAYLRSSGEPAPPAPEGPLFMAGHQPELFHPGVWVKNFAIGGFARQYGGTAVNLVVDNDTAKSTSLRVPTRSGDGWPHLGHVSFDQWTPTMAPYEEAFVRDEELFASFPARMHEAMRAWNVEPLLGSFWVEVQRQAQRTRLLGERFASARRALERQWGCHNLEVPVSRVCRTESFAWFACHLLTHLPRFLPLYNDIVRDYRRAHGLRSHNHPVPDLVTADGWLEVPLWGWRQGQSRRQRLMARQRAGVLELRAGADPWPALPSEAPQMIAAWQELERNGFKVRSRALTNTLFARLFVCDLFVHGIGGGKYDELTDELVRRFYGVEPPSFLVLSATLLLPLRAYPVRAEDEKRLAWAERDLHYNPQRHLPANLLDHPEVRPLLQEKDEWVRRQPPDERGRRERFEHLRTLTEQLRRFVGDRFQGVQRDLEKARRQLQANTVLQRRDYAFCLYPEAPLRRFCQQLLAGSYPGK
jgi:hypothetical protein